MLVRNKICCTVLLSLGSLLGGGAHAQAEAKSERFDLNATVQRQMEEDRLARLRGWREVVVFCSPPGDGPRAYFERICQRALATAGFLAQTAKVRLHTTTKATEVGFRMAADGAPTLELDLHQSGCTPGESCAVAVSLMMRFSYKQGVDQAAREYRGLDGKSPSAYRPSATPRPFDAILWGPIPITASGAANEELATALVGAIDTALKNFFTDFMKANPR